MNRYIILLSGGTGSRFNSALPKQYKRDSHGEYYFVNSVKCFESQIKLFNKLVVICANEFNDLIRNELNFLNIDMQFVVNGSTRQESINNGIEYLRTITNNKEENEIFLQEAVRPYVHPKHINNLINMDHKYQSVSLSQETYVLYSQYNKERHEATNLIEKGKMVELQLPKRYDLNFWHAKTQTTPYNITAIDESQLFLDYKINIKCIEGSMNNLKITYPNHKKIGSIISLIMKEELNEN